MSSDESPTAVAVLLDEHHRDVARSAHGELAELTRIEVLTAADVQTARRLGRLARTDEEPVLLAVALAVRAVRHGAVCLELDRAHELAPDRTWPDPARWRDALLASPLVRPVEGDGVPAAAVTPLVLDGDLLYLDRYWREEGQVRDDLRTRSADAPTPPPGLDAALDVYFPAADDDASGIAGEPPDDFADQRAAAATAARGWTSVVVGGPGTGKTTTIARLLGVLLDGDPAARIALAAPTGRAAARLAEAVHAAVQAPSFPTRHRAALADLPATTLHRLLGWRPDQRSRFRHHRGNRLPYDVVVVDETSMVSLTLMARLLEAVRPQTRLVLVGDPDQLASVDAGAVLGDLVEGTVDADPPVVAQLTRNRRFEVPGLALLADAIRRGDADAALAVLADSGDVELIDPEQVEPLALAHARRLVEVASSGDAQAALTALDAHRLLCAHREGPAGANTWNRRVERDLAGGVAPVAAMGSWYVGRPLIVTENDYGLDLFNGDVGVVLPPAEPGSHALRAAIADGRSEVGRAIATARLSEVRSAHAMTVHRSQGSQVEEVTVLLPPDDSRLLTRQLLYTAVTRARRRVRVAGTPDQVRAAIAARAQRASGLADRLRRP